MASFAELNHVGGREIAVMSGHSRPALPTNAGGHAVPVANTATNARLRILAEHANSILEQSGTNFIVSPWEQHIIPLGQRQAAVEACIDTEISFIAADPYNRMFAR